MILFVLILLLAALTTVYLFDRKRKLRARERRERLKEKQESLFETLKNVTSEPGNTD